MSSPAPLSLPKSLPVMVLAGCTLFPHSMMPLYLFEPRYREMLSFALRTDRMFGMANLDATGSWQEEDETDDKISKCMTAGVVRACVGQPDGTSRLMLQGISRVRVTGWEQKRPFRIAFIQPVRTVIGNVAENAQLSARLLRIVLEIIQGSGPSAAPLAEQLKGLKDPEVLSDFVAANFLREPGERQQALELDELGPRLHFLLGRLGQS